VVAGYYVALFGLSGTFSLVGGICGLIVEGVSGLALGAAAGVVAAFVCCFGDGPLALRFLAVCIIGAAIGAGGALPVARGRLLAGGLSGVVVSVLLMNRRSSRYTRTQRLLIAVILWCGVGLVGGMVAEEVLRCFSLAEL
jgi:hypothetical protein